MSAPEMMELMREFIASPEGGLRIYTPALEYLFAMKCMTMRSEGIEGSHDISGIQALAERIGIADTSAALAIVEGFHLATRIPPKVRFGEEEIFDNPTNKPMNARAVEQALIERCLAGQHAIPRQPPPTTSARPASSDSQPG